MCDCSLAHCSSFRGFSLQCNLPRSSLLFVSFSTPRLRLGIPFVASARPFRTIPTLAIEGMLAYTFFRGGGGGRIFGLFGLSHGSSGASLLYVVSTGSNSSVLSSAFSFCPQPLIVWGRIAEVVVGVFFVFRLLPPLVFVPVPKLFKQQKCGQRNESFHLLSFFLK